MKQCSFDRRPIFMGDAGTHTDPFREETCPSCGETMQDGMSGHVRPQPMWFHTKQGGK